MKGFNPFLRDISPDLGERQCDILVALANDLHGSLRNAGIHA